MALDAMTIEESVAMINAQDARAVAAVGAEGPNISRAVEIVAHALRHGGRLIYVGAGTSGRLGVLDASECPPTFRVHPEMVQGIIAGGQAAMFRSQEGAEDRPQDGAAAMDAKNISASDVVMGIAAGGTTPFVHGALRRAIERGARTIFLACVEPVAGEPQVDVAIRPLVGPEVLTGSTRLKAGTATKLVLNTITTLAMVRLGKVYENLMVDLRASNDKLWDRGARIIATLTGLDRRQSLDLLKRAEGHVKAAIVMQKRSVDLTSAQNLLDKHGGHLRAAMTAAD
jgi:N-acetylmuramic acid 6-phosphate etherase